MATQVITMDLLGRGTHTGPRRGCNVLELASVLAGERWSSSPQSVHPALAMAAEAVNDLLTDDRKRLLVPLARWLPGTNSADPRIWPAVASACIRAGLASAPGPDQPWFLAELNRASQWLVLASSASGGRRGYRTRRQDWRWVMDASRSALLRVASSADPEAADAALCQALVECINACRRLAGEGAVDPLLPLADCPRCLLVRPRAVWSPGCDWMEQGYQLVTGPQPARAPAAPAGMRPTSGRRPLDVRGKPYEKVTGYADGWAGRGGDPTVTCALLNPASAAGRGSRQSGNPQRAFRIIPGPGGSGWRVCVRSGVKVHEQEFIETRLLLVSRISKDFRCTV